MTERIMDTNEKAGPTFYDELSMQTYEEQGGGYLHVDMGRSLHVFTRQVRQNRQGLIAELDILYPDDSPIRQNIILNLQDHKARQSLALELAGACPNAIPWDKVLGYVCNSTIEHYRQGEPSIELWTNQDTTPPEYYAKPTIQKGVANIWYGEQTSAKTLEALLHTILITLSPGVNSFGLELQYTPNIMLLDYENNANMTLWNLKRLTSGMGLPDIGIRYLPCSLPLSYDISRVMKEIQDNNIEIIFIDSLGLAVGGDLKDSAQATSFYSALRQLKTTSVILAHTSKGLEREKTVFGSIYFENLSRNIFELQKVDTADNQIQVAFHHRKSSFSGKCQPIGFQFTFDLDRIYVESINPADEPTFREKMSIGIRIKKELENGEYSASELAGMLNEKLNSVTHALYRMGKKGEVDKSSDGKWKLHSS
jgi:hypothetical protein